MFNSCVNRIKAPSGFWVLSTCSCHEANVLFSIVC